MPQIEISDDINSRLVAFQPFAKWLEGKEVPLNQIAENLLSAGLDTMLNSLWGQHDQATLITSLKQLAERHPAEVFQYIADVLKKGTKIENQKRREELREQTRPFGFAARVTSKKKRSGKN